MTREITSHKVNGLNEQLHIRVLDEPGKGGASHEYTIETDVDDVLCNIDFQNGPVAEFGVNGISHEALLAIVQDRLESFQAGSYACNENAIALNHVVAAIQAMHSRTLNRTQRGVEGTSAL